MSIMNIYTSKVLSITGRGSVKGCETVKIGQCLYNRFIVGVKFLSITHRPRSTPQKYFYFFLWYSFLSEAE
jgi:hypothetical protein